MKKMVFLSIFFILSINLFAQLTDKELAKKQKKFVKEFSEWAYIPKTSFYINKDSTYKIDEFFMQKTEVSNADWQFFLSQIKKEKGEDAIKDLLPDSSLWLNLNGFEAYEERYHTHPAYQNYPVVNITYAQAEAYCKFVEEYFNNLPDKKYKSVEVRLPTEGEWEHAARGSSQGSLFPWGGSFYQNSKGDYLANFFRVDQTSIEYGFLDQNGQKLGMVITGQNGDKYSWLNGSPTSYNLTISSPTIIDAYFGNEFGLFCMSGNVSEFVKMSDLELKAFDNMGITKGGSWGDTAFYIMISTRQFYNLNNSASPLRGFRPIMKVQF
jgi:formylglycine-generating enzyme required for sulfatase activity